MKCTWILLLLLSILPAFACQAQEATPSIVDHSALEDGAREAFKKYAGLIRANKFIEAVEYYADDPRFVWVEDGSIKYDSKAQIQRAFENINLLGEVENSFALPTIWALNDNQVMVFSRFRTTVAKGTDKEFTYSGAITVVMEQTDAGWKFVSGHSSSTPASKGF